MPTDSMENNVYKVDTFDYVNKCRTVESLMLTQYVRYSGEFNADIICVVQETV